MGARQIATTAGHGRPDLLGQMGPDGTRDPPRVPSRPNSPNRSGRSVVDGHAIAALLGEAEAAGCSFDVAGAGAKVRAEYRPPADLMTRLRRHKAEILELLRGDRCRRCGARMAWPEPVGVVHGDGRASCFACHHDAALRQASCSPDALAGPAGLTARGEPLR
jgi:hypothetical protein